MPDRTKDARDALTTPWRMERRGCQLASWSAPQKSPPRTLTRIAEG
jgi:hypothetical protein